MYNLTEHRDCHSKTSGNSWQYCRYEPATALEKSESFKSKIRWTGKISAYGNIKNVEITVSLKYLSNLSRILEMSFD